MPALLRQRAVVNAAVAGLLASIVVWLGPPGADLAAHVFQRNLFLTHGFALWTNYWYAGRYSFVGYSLLYYPLAAVLGIKLLAVLSVAAASGAFTLVAERAFGTTASLASRFFAVAAAASALSAAFPYALGLALALFALLAVERRQRALFAVFVALTLAASPLAFLLLSVILAGVGVSRSRREITQPAIVIAVIGAIGLLLLRLFPNGGSFPF